MKEFVQEAGIRRWHGSEFVKLQEALNVLQTTFGVYGAFIIQGCAITSNSSNWDISAGLVAINHADGFKIAEFAGITNQALPGYLSINKSVAQKVYQDLLTKDASYTYTAVFTAGAAPDGSDLYLPIASQSNPSTSVPPLKLSDAWGNYGTTESATVSFTNGFVPANTLKLTLNRGAKQVHLSGSITISNYTGLLGADNSVAIGGSADVPMKYRPATRQYFLAYVQDPGGGTTSNFYMKDINNIDYSRHHVGWIESTGHIFIRFVKPASGTSQVLDIRGIISLI